MKNKKILVALLLVIGIILIAGALASVIRNRRVLWVELPEDWNQEGQDMAGWVDKLEVDEAVRQQKSEVIFITGPEFSDAWTEEQNTASQGINLSSG